jgi:hypothetical protein
LPARAADLMARIDLVAHALAEAALCGPWTADDLAARFAVVLGRAPPALAIVARRIVAELPVPPRDPPLVEEMLFESAELREANGAERLRIARWLLREPSMRPAPLPLRATSLPKLETVADVARWLGVDDGRLHWFAGAAGRERRAPDGPLRHYTCRWVRKKSGDYRLLEAPKGHLKALQRRILHEILDRVPPHEAAHGFRRDRSVLTFASEHVGREMIVAVDLADFFASVRASRVAALFTTLGYPAAVARVLTGLSTNAVPASEWSTAPSPRTAAEVMARADAFRRFRVPHLPQGAPTSPALANLCAFRLDLRLAAAARAVGACYGRYADDLVFSGGPDLARTSRRLLRLVARVAADEGSALQPKKTRLLGRGGRQCVAGVVVNDHLNVPRRVVDRLEATLFNAARFGPASQNRDGHADFRAHLRGRVAWVAAVNPARGAELQRLFDGIDWSSR